MNVLHLQLTGNPGGIVSLCYSIAKNSENNNHMYFLLDGGTVEKAMREEEIPTHVAYANRYYWHKSKKELLNYCKEHEIDVVVNHSNSPIACSHTVAIKKSIPTMRVISYLHADSKNIVNTLYKKILYKPYIKRVHKIADNIVAISNFVKKSALEVFKLKDGDVVVIHNGVDYEYFADFKKERSAEVLKLVYVGRLFEQKGVGLLIESISNICDSIPIKLRIVGRGPQQKELEELSKKLNISDRIEFLGLRMDVPELLGDEHFFVHPATLEEGFGITLIEAMSEGIPCIAFDKGAIPEIINDGDNGFIIKEESVGALAKTIEKCYEIVKSDKYNKMSEKASVTGKKFDIKEMVKKLEKTYC